MFDKSKVDGSTVIGQAILAASSSDDKDAVSDQVYQICKDNFCIAIAAIGYENMNILRPGLIDKVNELARRALTL